jgi:succinate dehydrogenase/fumarate reductase-like Fe-S protein
MEDKLMRHIILTALITCLAVGTAAAQSCDSKAVSAHGKPLHRAAKMSFVKKCKRDACGSQAVGADGKPLHGAAKNSFMAKCIRSA